MTSAFLAMSVAIGGLTVSGGKAVAQVASTNQSAQELLKTGLAAQKARKHAAAISLLSRAINSGSLQRKQMTYALYRRAVSNRLQRQSAQAISDLNSALFFKGDLSSRDRANAIEERMKAFEDAGLQPTSVATASGGSQWAPSSIAPKAVVEAPRSRVISTAPRRVLEPVKVMKPIGRSVALPAGVPILAPATADPKRRVADRGIAPFQTRVAAASTKPAPQAAPASSFFSFLTPQVERGEGVPKQPRSRQTAKKPAAPTIPWQVATKSEPTVTTSSPVSLPKTTAAVKPATRALALPVSKPVPTAPSVSNDVGQFFSNMFGGSSSTPVASPHVTGSVVQPKAVATTATATNLASRKTVAAALAPRKPVQVAAAQPLAAVRPSAPVARSAVRGKFEIEVAQLRSKDRADAFAKQLVVQYSSSNFWSTRQTARVQEKQPAAGEEGALYSVRYGVYSSKTALSEMCDTLKADGLDCAPVRQN